MEVKLYVGNLPFSTDDEELQSLFQQAGTVKSARVIKDRDRGHSRGFAFVEMSDGSEAHKAISMFNGYTLNERPLTVSLARPREERSGGFRGGRESSGTPGGFESRLAGDSTTDAPPPPPKKQ